MNLILNCWTILCQLAPWLLLGMLLSGMLHVLLPPGFVRRKFHGFAGVIKSVLLGVPLPLCSCGVIPAGIGLKNQGASNGASVAFLISTPQTGVDSILVSSSFFGWPFAIFKMVTAAITGVFGGWLTDQIDAIEEAEQVAISNTDNLAHSHGSTDHEVNQSAWWRIWSHGLEIVRSIWGWLLIGILISAVIETYDFNVWFEAVGQWGLLPSMLLVLVVSVPLYVCATASVPIAAAMVSAGLPAAAALVFLMAGPATNITTIGAIYGRFGWRTLLIYLSTIIVGSMFFAWMFDWLLTANVVSSDSHAHNHQAWWAIGSGLILSVMVAQFAWSDFARWWRGRTQYDSDVPRLEIPIQGMTCGGCVDKIESAIRKSEGVESIQIDLKSGIATVFGKPKLEELERLIMSLGFQVVSKQE